MPPPPPPPPDEPPPDDAHLGAPAGVQPLPSAPVRRSVAKHGVALPGYKTARAGDAGLAQAEEPEPELAQVRRDEWGRPIDLTREQAEREAAASGDGEADGEAEDEGDGDGNGSAGTSRALSKRPRSSDSGRAERADGTAS